MTVFTLDLEGLGPWLLVGTGTINTLGVILQLELQVGIAGSGNYGFFTYLEDAAGAKKAEEDAAAANKAETAKRVVEDAAAEKTCLQC